MDYLLLIYTDDSLLEQVPEEEFAKGMRSCLLEADKMREAGTLKGYSRLEAPKTARTVRIRDGRSTVLDGPFAETKEVLAGYQLIQADSMEEAVEIASHIPWAAAGAIEVRPVRDDREERRLVGL